MELKDKVAVVTGAASGIGKEIATDFSRAGAKVAIADLMLDPATAVANELSTDGRQAMAVAMDVSNEAQVERGIADVIAAYGTVDILVSNAGIQIVSPIVDFAFDDWRK